MRRENSALQTLGATGVFYVYIYFCGHRWCFFTFGDQTSPKAFVLKGPLLSDGRLRKVTRKDFRESCCAKFVKNDSLNAGPLKHHHFPREIEWFPGARVRPEINVNAHSERPAIRVQTHRPKFCVLYKIVSAKCKTVHGPDVFCEKTGIGVHRNKCKHKSI